MFRTPGNPETKDDIGIVTIGDGAKPTWLLQGPYAERNAEISPDGRWIAYQSDESGQWDIYVRPFPDVDEDQTLVSRAGGVMPLWSRDGRELFYLEQGPPTSLMSVFIEASETVFSLGARTPLLDWPYRGVIWGAGRTYDVSPNGQRFLAIKELQGGSEAGRPQIIIVENWFDELTRLAPPTE